MGWVFVVVLAALAVLALWRFARLPRGGAEILAATALVALAGYALQGKPDMAGTPVQSRAQTIAPDLAAIRTRQMMTDNYGDAAKVAAFADTLDRLGMTREAVIAVRTGLRKTPDNPELWVSMGNALVAHGGGLLSPAAEHAYQRAASLAPTHPAPPFFLGLALAQGGRFEEASKVWRDLLARTPADAPWRADLEARLGAIGGAPVSMP